MGEESPSATGSTPTSSPPRRGSVPDPTVNVLPTSRSAIPLVHAVTSDEIVARADFIDVACAVMAVAYLPWLGSRERRLYERRAGLQQRLGEIEAANA